MKKSNFRLLTSRNKRLVALLLAVSFLMFSMQITTFAHSNKPEPISGAIWTTNSSGTVQNHNIYASKSLVYFKGGNSLPNGYYYVKVESPQGTLLGKSSTAVVHVTNHVFGPFKLWDYVKKASNSSKQGFDDTTNNGGEYKVTIAVDRNFSEDLSKSDNFKVKKEDLPIEIQTASELYEYSFMIE